MDCFDWSYPASVCNGRAVLLSGVGSVVPKLSVLCGSADACALAGVCTCGGESGKKAKQ